jgi:cytochrome c5
MKKSASLFLLLTLLVFILAACSQAVAPATTSGNSSDSTQTAPTSPDGKALTEKICTQCHDLGRVQNARGSADQWKAVVERMIQKFPKSNLTPPSADEEAAIIKYLSDTYK